MTNPKRPPLFKPTLIIHGGAGNITRDKLPPALYRQYRASLLKYLRSTYQLLKDGSNALDAAVHAVSLLEDDELFNCGRGSVFTSAGTIEMEASVMVTSLLLDPNGDPTRPEQVKRGVGVIGLRNVRHPIQLAREVLLRTGIDEYGNPRPSSNHGGNMHSQLSGRHLEKLARDWGLEFKPDEWFCTQRRWEEHRRGLERGRAAAAAHDADDDTVGLSQGTVGCVCLDQWGNLAVATSTGGMTNKLPGRVGDTPTLGAGFWAETWEEKRTSLGPDNASVRERRMVYQPSSTKDDDDKGSSWSTRLRDLLHDCLAPILQQPQPRYLSSYPIPPEKQPLLSADSKQPNVISPVPVRRRRAVALSGTGNGDSFLRTNAARTASAMLRFASPAQALKLSDAVTAVAGPGGELQQSAGPRWGVTGEGEGGLIGIEAEIDLDEDKKPVQATKNEGEDDALRRGRVVFDFNCGGMYRAWIEEDPQGREVERVMVFKDEYVE